MIPECAPLADQNNDNRRNMIKTEVSESDDSSCYELSKSMMNNDQGSFDGRLASSVRVHNVKRSKPISSSFKSKIKQKCRLTNNQQKTSSNKKSISTHKPLQFFENTTNHNNQEAEISQLKSQVDSLKSQNLQLKCQVKTLQKQLSLTVIHKQQ